MKVGDAVMFTSSCGYAKWFFGQLAIVESYTEKGSDGHAHCRVRWMQPVPYFSRLATISDFRADKFEVATKEQKKLRGIQ
mgnify:CR=1 FL=1|tara:strand:- start:79 stop:318 length:240 start_codon:yes stop_codon:yes gene_type:complete